MSAIVGIFSSRGEVDLSNNVNLMMEAIPEFASDGQSRWVSDVAGFGHLKMETTPQSKKETQPYFDQQTQLVITADIRLDNRNELNRLLALEDHKDEIPDSVYVMQAYKKWGSDCPKFLIGDYAISIWDQQKQELILVRDSSGIKPLFYAQTSRGFVFASNINALLALPFVNHDYDEKELAGFLLSKIWIQKEETFFKHIKKLPQANILIMDTEKLEIQEYWNIRNRQEIYYINEQEYLEHFKGVLNQAITDRLRTNKKIGSHISGGLDSTPITIMANDLLQQFGKSLTAGYTWSPAPENDPKCGELELLQWVEQYKQILIRYCDLSVQESAEIYARDITRQPNNTLFSEYNILKKAKTDLIGVMLSGWGGDEIVTFNGRGHFTILFTSFQWKKLYKELGMTTSGKTIKGKLRIIKKDLDKKYGRKLDELGYLIHTKRFQRNFVSDLLITQINKWHENNQILKPGFRNNQNQLWEYGHLANRAEDWHHHGALFNVEYRYPLLDRRVVEFMMAIPDDLVFRTPWRGYLMRKMAETLIPADKAWGNLKKEDYRQPLFRAVLDQGLSKWTGQVIQNNFVSDYVISKKLIDYLKTYDFESNKLEQNQRVRRLLQVATLPME